MVLPDKKAYFRKDHRIGVGVKAILIPNTIAAYQLDRNCAGCRVSTFYFSMHLPDDVLFFYKE
jgi:hypothetical protein